MENWLSLSLNCNYNKTHFLLIDLVNCEGLAVDWVGMNLFWTDEGRKTISVASLENPSVTKILIEKYLSHPRAIALDPRYGRSKGWVPSVMMYVVMYHLTICIILPYYFMIRYMYWTDWAEPRSLGDSAKIEQADMNGDNRHVLVTKDIMWPNGLTVDLQNNRLYWCDSYFNTIASISLDESDAQKLVRVV